MTYDVYLLNVIGLTPGGSSTVHIYTQTIHRTTQLTNLVGKLSGTRTQSGQTNWKECGPCLIFASYTLEFALQLLNVFRMLLHPSSGACDLFVEFFMGCIVLVQCVLVLRTLVLQSAFRYHTTTAKPQRKPTHIEPEQYNL